MSSSSSSATGFGEGPLSRVAAFVYTLLVVELLFFATTLPGLLLLMLLDRDTSNLPLVALCAAPLGPALSAALYALRHRHRDITDLHPAAAFWRGYRMNVGGVLRTWLPALAWLTIIAMNLAHLGAAGNASSWRLPLLVIALGVTLWTVNALVITSLFAFRTRDIARLAGYFLVRTPGVTLANAALLVVAAGITALASEVVLALLGSILALSLLHGCRRMITMITEEFTA